MKLQLRALRLAHWPARIRGMFNLNDPRWGRGDDKPADASKPEPARPQDELSPPPQSGNGRGQNPGPTQGPPDLDELWRDFNRKLSGFFGGGQGGGGRPGNNGGGFQPSMKSAGIGVGLKIGRAHV